MNIKFFLAFAVTAVTVIAGCTDHPEAASTESVYDRQPIKVTTHTVGTHSSAAGSVLSGTIRSKSMATLSARMMGYITSISADVGDRVRAGQTILSIRSNDLKAQQAQATAMLAEAEAALQNMKVNYDRMKALWEQESITRKEWDDISTQYQMMLARVEAAIQKRNEINEVISFSTVKAPIAGVVTAKMINKGDLVNPGVPLMTIDGTQGYEVTTYVSDHQISAVKMGMMVGCRIQSLDKVVQAKVTEISPSAVNTGGQFAIKAALQLSAEDQNAVFPGMYAGVIADLPGYSDQVSYTTVEKSAVIERGQLTGIYTVSNQGTALLRWLRVGKDFGDRVEVVSGLTDGEEYIVSDLTDITDGIPVKK